jgi:predicted membrane protein
MENMMTKKNIDVMLCVASIFCWFLPFYSISGMFGMANNVEYYQSGEHIKGIAYLMLIAPVAFAYFSWTANSQLKLIAAGSQLLLCALFVLSHVGSLKYGLILLFALALYMVVKSLPPKKVNENPINEP